MMTEKKPVTITAASSRDVGSCNGCDRYITAEGGIEHRVWSLRFAHGPEVRLCDDCLEELRAALPPVDNPTS